MHIIKNNNIILREIHNLTDRLWDVILHSNTTMHKHNKSKKLVNVIVQKSKSNYEFA